MAATFFLRNGHDFHREFEVVEDLPYEYNATQVLCSIYVSDATHLKCLKFRTTAVTRYAYFIISNVLPAHKYAMEFAYQSKNSCGCTYQLLNRNSGVTIARATIVATNTWKNLYKEYTLSAACSVLELRLRRQRAAPATFYLIDDLKIQGNALLVDPDDYSIDYEDETFDHKAINANVVRDRAGLHVVFNMQFPNATASVAARLVQLAKSKSDEPAYFNDGALPTMTEYQTLRVSKTYNFAGVTVGHKHNAFRTLTTMQTPSSKGVAQAASFTLTLYQRIATDNATYCTLACTTTNKYGYHKFVWKATEYASVGHIEKISFIYKGNCEDGSAKNVDGIELYAWDGYNWALLDTSRTGDDQTLSFNTAQKEIAQQFVDTTSKYIRLIAKSRGFKQATGAVTLKTQYVKCTVNDQLSKTFDFRNKAVISATGGIAAVKNVTDNVALVNNQATTGYRIKEDRMGIVLTSDQGSGDKIEAKYQAEYMVVVDSLQFPMIFRGVIATPRRTISLRLKTLRPLDEL